MPATPDKMFDDDSFNGIEDLFNQLVGGRNQPRRSSRGRSQNILNTVESGKATTLIFDLSGKKLVSAKIQDDLEINEYGEKIQNGQKTLVIKLENNETLKYNLPKALVKRKLDYTFSNGILEVSLKK